MSSATDTHVLLRAFAEELVRCGLPGACTSPGSRSAPLVLALAGELGLRCYSHVDERCAGFFALGLAKASGLPVAVACTSGTAAAQLHAAAIEAREARVPLLLLTADRPAELRDNGAGQAIDQLHLYGRTVKWFAEVELPPVSGAALRWVRTLACRAYWTALEGRPGPVHLNFPLRDPLVTDEPLPAEETARPGGVPYVRRAVPPGRVGLLPRDPAAEALAGLLRHSRRGLLVTGREERPSGLPAAAAGFATAAGWPLLADPMSGARRGRAAIAHYDALLRDADTARELRPDLVLRVGDLPVSKPLREWLAGLDGVAQVALDPEGAWQDPAGALSHSLAVDPAGTLDAIAAGEGGMPATPLADPSWLASWRAADERAAGAILGVLAGELSEPALAAELGTLLPAAATLFVASSMPVRDLETFWPVREDPPRVLCNRGANGIDGTVSSAFGAAAAGQPTLLLTGDVALAHDIGGLLAARRLGLELTIVLIDNGGGGIFDFLPVARTPPALVPVDGEQDLYTRHVATPTGLDFADAARMYGLAHTHVADLGGLRAALEQALAEPGSSIVEVRTDRSENVRLHRRVWEAVSRALAE